MKCSSWAFISVILLCQCHENVSETFIQAVSNLYKSLGPSTRKMTTDSLFTCLQECLKRKGCRIVGFFKVGKLMNTCGLDMTKRKESTMIGIKQCKKAVIYIKEIPKKLGGACESHNCRRGQECFGKPDGGYGCRKDRKNFVK